MKKNTLHSKNSINSRSEYGAVMMVSVIFFVVISVIAIMGIAGPTAIDYKMANDSILSRQSYFLAESGAEDVYYRLKNSQPVDQSENLVLGNYFTATHMDNLGGGDVDISSMGNAASHMRGADMKVSGQNNFIFSFGVQSGFGGVDLETSGSSISGDVFTSGPITAVSGASISGSAVSASKSLSIDQANDVGTPPYDIWFGDSDSTRGIFQSFSLSQGGSLNKISLYIKKVGSPTDLNVYLYNNDEATGKPGTLLIATSTISASSVGGSYSWIDAVFSQKQMLSVGNTYWFVVQGTTNPTDYYTIATTGNNYTNGVAKSAQLGSSSWWADPVSSGADYFFRIYLGGTSGSVLATGGSMNIGTISTNNVEAESVTNANVSGNIYCSSGSGNNKSCLSYDNPSTISYAISDSDIFRWKSDAASGGTCGYSPWNTGTFSKVTTGPRKCVGDLNIGGGYLTINGTLWVAGNLNISGGGRLLLNSSYGANTGVVVVDGKVSINGGYVNGSGTSGSHILVISMSNSIDNTSPAILSSYTGAENAVLYAPYGLVRAVGSSSPNQLSGYKVSISNANIVYDTAISMLHVLSTSSTSSSLNISSWTQFQ